ncbi:MAG: glycoside hydrolase family 3 protein [Candidatus Pacebacteria bacterium]|jgi:beta-glucosidase-like glycosyl hydrolase|nr:glycoside hydrolase family 3 protein [Candidatus Paceibacterota bacterium]MBT4005374.1 glycoside hydrolase family 3 protein [Candidatus Paceibacterota bacterium]MBT6898411.1 glycoside hydrolase family 3 protein [Candidatus Paceibacterota bacterium]MBT7499089.1 glycoside hydrolase family 3 protein [Candidatus Paceibacterota bacterium]
MPRSTIFFLLILTIIASALGYNYFARPFSNYQAAQIELTELIPEEEENNSESAEETFSDQDLAQLIAFPYSLDDNQSTQSASLSWIKLNQPGLITLFGSKVSTAAAKIATDKISSSFDDESEPLIAVDHEGGSVQRLSGSGFTSLPSWKSICAAGSTQRQDLLSASAQELSRAGVDLVFAPVIDIASQSAILKDRICSSNPETVIARATEFIDIFAQQKIIPVIKHYPGIGSTSRDLHFSFDEVNLKEEEILVFKDILEEYPLIGVMSAHVGVKDRYEDEPCSLNVDCIDDLTGFFPGVIVFTDALDMDSAGYAGEDKELIILAERAVSAIKAGNNVLVFGPNIELGEFDEVIAALKTAYELDEDFQKQAQQSIKKIRQYKEVLKK